MSNKVREQAFRDISSVKLVRLGAYDETIDGRGYRYGLAGAADLAKGKINVAAAHVANHVNLTLAVGADAGASKVTVPLGATAATANQYADGQLVVNDGTAEGTSYLISGNPAAGSGATVVVNLEEPLEVALTTASDVSLIANPYSGVIVAPGAIAHRPVGVANVTITAAYYGWFQTQGDCAVLSDNVITKGAGAILSDAVAGALEIEVAATVVKRVGFAPEATVDTEYRVITLTLE